MQPTGYSHYKQKKRIRSTRFKVEKPPIQYKKWLWGLLGVFIFFMVLVYLLLGPFRFFANHYFALAFFDKDYLIILQNDAEIRPTGGFLTAVGEAKMRVGFPSGIHFYNSYAIDTEQYVPPPEPHEDMLGSKWYQGYTFRDANWNPDFPSATTELIDFYQQKFPDKDVDGIVAINFSVIEALVDAFGGIELDGKKVTSENLFSLVTHSVNNVDRHNEQALDERKDILGPIFNQVRGQMIRHPFKAKRVISEALETKEMFMWFKNERLQRKIVARNWGNHLVIPDGSDFLHVNVANLGSGKIDRYLQPVIKHRMNLSGDVPEGRIEFSLDYAGQSNSYFENYGAYVRFYLHPLAQVDTGDLESEVIKDEHFTIISDRITVAPGEQGTLVYTYTLPEEFVTQDSYQLYLAKQSGSEMWLDLLVEGAEGVHLSSPQLDTRENRGTLKKQLTQDQSIQVNILPDVLSPYPVEQQFIDLNTIEIRWNETIDENMAEDVLNYSITDMNYTNANVTDEIKITDATWIGKRRVELDIEGASSQELERYTLTLKNLTDRSGNALDPNPKLVTIVQRLEEEEVVVDE